MKKKQIIKTIGTMAILSAMIMTISFGLSSARLNLPLFKSYFQQGLLIWMNFIPIFLFMAFIYLISNRLWLGYLVTALTFTFMGIVNKLKLTYRDDPFTFLDMKLVGESLEMTKTYDLSLSTRLVAIIVGLVAMGILLKIFFQPRVENKNTRIGLLVSLAIVSLVIFKGYYFSQGLYDRLGDRDVINQWVESERYQSKGFVYPFVYSMQEGRRKSPEGYDPKEAEEILFQNTYEGIPEDEKVNIISIMLEAYNDFSEFEGVDLNIDVYEKFHELQKESIHGRLVTNVFAGDTIDTERGFITGYHLQPKYYRPVNSFPWYFKQEGYRTESMHPITGSFYNRRNVNEYLGFDQFHHYDNKYRDIQEEYLMDMEFFDYIIEGFEESKKGEEPYFHFSVTYQNHGPYSQEKYTEKEYLAKKSHYDDGNYNIINNYLAGINKTGQALEKLFHRFRKEEEPTIIIVFGDHNPWLGQGNSGYDMLDINLDLSTLEGFKNYYQTPYLIWGNQEAKNIFQKDFIGEGPSLSPNLLMAELFDYVGWKGNEYMQYIQRMKKSFTVNHELYFKEDGRYTTSLSPENEKLWKEFQRVEYYYSNSLHES